MSADWTLAIYVIAETDQLENEAMAAVAEMRAALSSDRCTVALQLNAKSARKRYWISLADKTLEDTAAPVDTTKAATLSAFLDDVAAKFPAARVALVPWAHGFAMDDLHTYLLRHREWPPFRPRGWPADLPLHPSKYKLGADPVFGGYLTDPDARDGIAGSGAKRVDLLAFNACWMGSVEAQYEMRDVASALVASQTHADSWPYGEIVKAVCKSPSMSAEQLGAALVGIVRAGIQAGKRKDSLSALRGGADMSRLAAAIDAWASALIPLIATDWPSLFDALFVKPTTADDPNLPDLAALAHVLGAGDPAAAAAAKNVSAALEKVVIAHTAAPIVATARGLAILAPPTANIDLAAAYGGLDFATNRWAAFLAKVQQRLAAS